jgi:diguanylate cyclase (GGDEF)-like protein
MAALWQIAARASPALVETSLLATTDPSASYTMLSAAPVLVATTAQPLPVGLPAVSWYRVRLPQSPILVLRNSLGADLQLLLPDGTVLRQRRGVWPVEQPQYSQLNLVFDLPKLAAGDSVYLSVAHAPPQGILLSLYERADYQALDADAIRLLSFCLGILLAFATLGFVFYIAERDRTSLVFASSLLLQFIYYGFMYGEAAYWPLIGAWWPHWVEISVLAGMLSSIFLSEVYARLIDAPERLPRLMRLIRLLYLWSAAVILITVVDWLFRANGRSDWAALASMSGNYLIVLLTVLLIGAMVVRSMQGQRRALIVLLATLVSASANAMRASQFAFGWVGLEWAWSLHVLGVAIASSLMSLALTQRFLGLRTERDRAQEMATHDPLTGALNRLGGMTIAQQRFAEAQRTGKPFCAAVLDLDHFKQVNDRFGHAVGDAALQLFASVTQSTLSGDQRLMRLGGEEFVLLLPGLDQQRALQHLNALRTNIQRRGERIGDAPCGLTVSIGVTQLRPDHASIDAMLNEADRALYVAKRSGRNRAVAFDDLPRHPGATPDDQTNA